MKVADLYPLWIRQGHDELAAHVERMQKSYDCLTHKDGAYGRSIKAILDLRIQMLAVWDAAPKELASVAAPAAEGVGK